MKEAKYPIGTKYITRHKHPRLCEVVDILKTYNAVGDLISIRYVSKYSFMGQLIIDSDVVQTTIDMGIIHE